MYRMGVYNPQHFARSLGHQPLQNRQRHSFGERAGVEPKADINPVTHTGNEVDSHSFLLNFPESKRVCRNND